MRGPAVPPFDCLPVPVYGCAVPLPSRVQDTMEIPFLAKITALAQRRLKTERREVKRLSPGQCTTCLIRNGSSTAPLTAAVQNLSVKGAGLLVDREYPSGTILPILIVNGSNTCAVALELNVVRSFRVAGGQWFVGGPFARPLTCEELVPFMM